MTTTSSYLEMFEQALDVKGRSGDELICLCPFHGDSTPSLWANARKGMWTCYACGEGGSAAGLLRKLGLPVEASTGPSLSTSTSHIREILRGIESRSHTCACSSVYSQHVNLHSIGVLTSTVEAPYNLGSSTPEELKASGSTPGRCSTCSRPLVLSEKYLKKFPASTSMKDYLEDRGVDVVGGCRGEVDAPSTAALFQLGWSTLSRSISIPYRTETGLLLGTVHRRLRGRPKYVYPVKFPRTENLFGSWLYPYADVLAPRRSLLGPNSVVLCEGSFDVMKVWQAGLPAVGMWGSLLHDKQVQILSKLGITSVVVFTDRDSPGRSAAYSAAGKLRRNGKLCKVVQYPAAYGPEYSDPGSLPSPMIRRRVQRAQWYWT